MTIGGLPIGAFTLPGMPLSPSSPRFGSGSTSFGSKGGNTPSHQRDRAAQILKENTLSTRRLYKESVVAECQICGALVGDGKRQIHLDFHEYLSQIDQYLAALDEQVAKAQEQGDT